ncbi:MAG: hypothetical protein GQ532_03580 [Methylomarinum sp.]|nr:hypothetical protein [Methylomarinum sp.]
MSKELTYKDSAGHNGHNYLGDIYEAENSALEKVIQQIVAASKESQELVDIIEDLTEYITSHPYREIIGLEKKLENGDRMDLLGNAILFKNKFSRRVAKAQMSLTEQRVYVQILSHIHVSFNQFVRPKILENSPASEIDSLVFNHIIEPAHKAIIDFDNAITKEFILGMLYFLTGKCHLVWDETC